MLAWACSLNDKRAQREGWASSNGKELFKPLVTLPLLPLAKASYMTKPRSKWLRNRLHLFIRSDANAVAFEIPSTYLRIVYLLIF